MTTSSSISNTFNASTTFTSPVMVITPSSSTQSTPAVSSLIAETSPVTGVPNGAVVAAVFGGIAVVTVVFCLGCLLCIRRRRRKRNNPPSVRPATSQEYESLPPVDTQDPTPSPQYEKRYDIENPAPAYLGKLKDLHLVPSRLKTLQLLTRTVSTHSSASTLVEPKDDKPEIYLERAYTLQPPIPDPDVYFNPHYLSTRRVSNGTTRTSLILDGVDSLEYSPEEDGRQPSRASLRFGRFSRVWGARLSVTSVDRMTVFDASHQVTSPDDPQTAKSSPTGTVKSPPTGRRGSQLLSNLRRGSLRSYQRVSSAESPAHTVTRFAPIKDVPEESSYYSTPLAPPPAKIKSRVTPQVRRGLIPNAKGTTSDGAMDMEIRPLEDRTDVVLPGASILASAVAKGKISREEAESALGMPLA